MINKNDRVRLTITDMGVNGEGVGRSDGLTFFVKNAVIGDDVLAQVTKVKKGYCYAKVMEIINPSAERVKPACPLAERCGGCQIMQLSYDSQLRFKENKVRNDIERIGGQNCKDILPIIGMERYPLHFRNKMQFPVGWDRNGHVATGFYAGRTHYLIGTSECPVSPDVNNIILETVRNFIERNRISTYNEETGKGLMRHVLVRNGFYTGQIMVCLVINGDSLEEGLEYPPVRNGWELNKDLCMSLTMQELPPPWHISSICLNINRSMTNVILGDEVRCMYGDPYIEDRIISSVYGIKALSFRINPLSFFQTNPVQTVKLYDTALQFAGLTGNETVWDLYCGIGTISLFLAQKAKKVYGVEIIPEAVNDAEDNARRNNISNAEFFCGRSEDIFPEKVKSDSEKYKADIVVLDPPRKGCGPELLHMLRKTGPERIVYVSCEPSTLARDIKILCGDIPDQEEGTYSYQLDKVQPVDMFPHTVHVECIALLQIISNT